MSFKLQAVCQSSIVEHVNLKNKALVAEVKCSARSDQPA
jgi:hypothetical protein